MVRLFIPPKRCLPRALYLPDSKFESMAWLETAGLIEVQIRSRFWILGMQIPLPVYSVIGFLDGRQYCCH